MTREERVQQAAALLWSTLWQEIGVQHVTPEMFASTGGGPHSQAYVIAAKKIIDFLEQQP